MTIEHEPWTYHPHHETWFWQHNAISIFSQQPGQVKKKSELLGRWLLDHMKIQKTWIELHHPVRQDNNWKHTARAAVRFIQVIWPKSNWKPSAQLRTTKIQLFYKEKWAKISIFKCLKIVHCSEKLFCKDWLQQMDTIESCIFHHFIWPKNENNVIISLHFIIKCKFMTMKSIKSQYITLKLVV